MAASVGKARGVHFVGSAPYANAEETFATIAAALPGRLKRIPDGETGERSYWTWWLYQNFPDWALTPLSYAAKLGSANGKPDPGVPYWFDKMVDPPERKPGENLVIKRPEYTEWAISSYKVFQRLKSEGKIDSRTRFQVSMSTSAGFVCTHVPPKYRSEADAVLEPLILDIVKEIQNAIPAQDLAIQFDVACEMGMLENEAGRSPDLWFAWFPAGTVMSELSQRLAKYTAAVNHDVELGYHFCYGDIGHQHWAQPLDTGRIASLFSEIRKTAQRPINFIHLPVPADRDDQDYFRPLADTNIGTETEIYLGLVREQDADGSQRRLAIAQSVMKRPFGVATECGLGRIGDTQLAGDVLQIAAAITEPAL